MPAPSASERPGGDRSDDAKGALSRRLQDWSEELRRVAADGDVTHNALADRLSACTTLLRTSGGSTEVRHELALRRDDEADARDSVADGRDVRAEARDVALGVRNGAAARTAAQDRRRAADDRAASSADRQAAAAALVEVADRLQGVCARYADVVAADRHLRVLHAVAVAANQAACLDEAMQACLAAVCRYCSWPVGHCYAASEDGRDLVPARVWHLDDPETLDGFRRVTDALRLRSGEGLPGQVLASGRPAWNLDIGHDGGFTQLQWAIEAGLRGSYAFPILFEEQVVGVLQFFSTAPEEPAAGLLRLMAEIGAQIGQVMGRARTVRELAESEQRMRTVVETSGDAYIAIDEGGMIIGWNAAAEAVLGWPSDEALGRTLVDTIIPPRHRAAHSRGLARALVAVDAPSAARRLQVEALHRDGHEVPMEVSVWAVRQGRTRRFNAFLRDVSERQDAEDRLREQALHDPLTGMANRLLLIDRLEQALARRSRDDTAVTVMFLDLDDFKGINDTHGHDAGDQVLCTVAQRLEGILRPSDTASRLGGDEFVIVCEGIEEPGAVDDMVDRIRLAVAEPCRIGTNGHISVTASVGAVTATSNAATARSLLHDADAAMYRAKRSRSGATDGANGRNTSITSLHPHPTRPDGDAAEAGGTGDLRTRGRLHP